MAALLREKAKALRRAAGSPAQRVLLSAGVSLACNLLYAVYNGALGVLNLSVWLVTMCAYYSILAVMRFAAVLCGWRDHMASDPSTQRLIGWMVGLLLAALSVVLAAMNALSLAQGRAAVHSDVVMISIAAYTFYKVGVSVFQAVRQRRDPSLLLAALRRVRYAEVAASVLTLQRSMLVSFGSMEPETAHRMNIATGAAVCLFVGGLGVTLLRKGGKTDGKVKTGPTEREDR